MNNNKSINRDNSKYKFIFNEIEEAIFLREIYAGEFKNYELVNRKACELLNYSEAELLNLGPEDIIAESDLGLLKNEERKQKLLKGERIVFRLNIKNKDGDLIPCENKAQLFELEGRKLVLTVSQDIRAQLEQQKKLKRKYEELKIANQSLQTINQRLNKLIDIITEISNYTLEDEEVFLKRLFRTALELIPQVEMGSVYIYKEDTVYFIDTLGHDREMLNSLKIPKGDFTKSIEVIKTVNINQDIKAKVAACGDAKNDIPELKETISVDIELENNSRCGISLDIKSGSSKQFDSVALQTFNAFKNIAQAFYKINNYDKLRIKFTREIMLAMINMLDFHDNYTKGHSENVAVLASQFAEYLGLTEEEQSRIYWAGLVHDIGKIAVPERILNKKGKLNQKEYELIKKHPIWAHESLKNSSQLTDIAEYVLYHHERWDGNGYPEGLSGNEIPLISQILSISDTWDAMRSNRIYRKALSYREARNEILENKGQQHSSELSDKFLACVYRLRDQ
jgi:PAS domain S-box-containing protein